MRSRRLWQGVAAIAGAMLLVAGTLTALDYAENHAPMRVYRSDLPNATDTGEVALLQRLSHGGTADVADLAAAMRFVQGGNDCSDFRLITLLRALYAHEGQFTPRARRALRDLFAHVRYWMDEPGMNAMVYWSENHQILFAASEFLAGQHYPRERFVDGRTGAEHRAAARARILFWLEQRWRFGFSEWNSHYYAEDIAPLSNLIDFAQDDEVTAKARIVLDLLLLDIATGTVRGEFIATSGRLYENNEKTGDEGIRRVLRHAFLGENRPDDARGIEINFLLSGYRTPAVLAAIARDPEPMISRTSFGRDLDELPADPSLATPERHIMALWGMEAFSNPRAIDSTLAFVRAHGLFANPYFGPLKAVNYRVLAATGMLPVLSRALDLPVNGLVLSRANVITYRTADFAMSTTQNYAPGTFGNQQHVFHVTLDQGVTLFHTHPAVLPHDPPPFGNSPGYWIGNGRLPLSCQEGAVNISLYDVPETPGFGRKYALAFTHLYAPLRRFDRVVLERNRLFLRHGNALLAVSASNPLERAGDSEIIQRGHRTVWVTEASSLRNETFEAFVSRVRKAATFTGDGVDYRMGRQVFSGAFGTGCRINGAALDTAYPRYESRYARIPREPTAVGIDFAGHTLALDFARQRRIEH